MWNREQTLSPAAFGSKHTSSHCRPLFLATNLQRTTPPARFFLQPPPGVPVSFLRQQTPARGRREECSEETPSVGCYATCSTPFLLTPLILVLLIGLGDATSSVPGAHEVLRAQARGTTPEKVAPATGSRFPGEFSVFPAGNPLRIFPDFQRTPAMLRQTTFNLRECWASSSSSQHFKIFPPTIVFLPAGNKLDWSFFSALVHRRATLLGLLPGRC